MPRNVGVSEKGCLTKMHKEKTAHCNYLLPYPWPKKDYVRYSGSNEASKIERSNENAVFDY